MLTLKQYKEIIKQRLHTWCIDISKNHCKICICDVCNYVKTKRKKDLKMLTRDEYLEAKQFFNRKFPHPEMTSAERQNYEDIAGHTMMKRLIKEYEENQPTTNEKES